ncbi:MAG TPA: hypothetical protein VK277_06820 [Acidimicrobiales bacterium]|nr:hypothetical protein [Acidimicrobiales bacterium]
MFLSSGCASCAGLWQALNRPELPFGPAIRLVVVTKGPEYESPAQVAASAPERIAVVMSTEAWNDYEVPGAPFFVLVDGEAGRRIGEGVASRLEQVAELVRRAEADRASMTEGHAADVPDHAIGLDGPARERANDLELRRAGILPGDPSLYPRHLDDVFGRDVPNRRLA